MICITECAFLFFIKSLKLKNAADLLHQDCVNVVWSHLIDSDLTIREE